MQKLIQPPACSDQVLHRILSSNWLVNFFYEKIHQSAALFGLDYGMLECLLTSLNPKNN
jgi:hypothetical protein